MKYKGNEKAWRANYRKANRETILARQRKYAKENHDHILDLQRKRVDLRRKEINAIALARYHSRGVNVDIQRREQGRRFRRKHADRIKAHQVRYRRDLTDGLIIRDIRGQLRASCMDLPSVMVPPNLIEAKRQEIKTRRMIRDRENKGRSVAV